jgi:hypothetical protein
MAGDEPLLPKNGGRGSLRAGWLHRKPGEMTVGAGTVLLTTNL